MIVFCFVQLTDSGSNVCYATWLILFGPTEKWKILQRKTALNLWPPSIITNIYATGASNNIPRPGVIYKVFSYLNYVNNRNRVR